MKKSIKVLFLFFFFVLNQGYSQTWQWAKQIGGPLIDGGGIVTNDNGSFFASGIFESICYFQTDTIYSNGFNDMFLASYDLNGNELWIKKFGGSNPFGNLESGGVSIDKINSVLYYSGQYYGTMIIDNDTVTSSTLDPFLAKFDFNGNCLWIKTVSSPAIADMGGGLLIDSSGTIYWNAILKEPGVIDGINLDKGTSLIKLTPNGSIISTHTQFKDAYSVVFKEHNNNLYFIGVTTNDTSSIDTMLLISNSQTDAFVCKTDINGSVIWAKRFGGTHSDAGMGLGIDNNENLYICGHFSDTLIFNSDTIKTSSFKDMFFAKINANGNLIWIKQAAASASSNASGNRLISDGDGNTYVVGSFSGSANFGGFNLNTSNQDDMFVARYNNSGDCVGIRNFGEAEAFQIQNDNNSNIYVSGKFINTVTIGNTSLTSHGDADIFIAKSDAITGLGGQNRVVQNQLVIYANPNKGTFNIKVPDEIKSFKQAWLYVYDVAGKEIARFNLDNESDTPHFDISNSKPGSYSVNLVQGDKMYSGQMIVE